MTGNDASNIKVYQKKKHVNIGIIIFGVVFIYLVMTVLLYLTAQHISVYEVREGSILRDSTYTGLALRNETVIRSDGKGYVNYFVSEGSKVGAKTEVYALSDQKLQFEEDKKRHRNLHLQSRTRSDRRHRHFVKIM